MAEHWPTWDELRAEDRAAGRIDEAKVAEHRQRILDAQRAYRLAEVRKSLGLTQAALAAAMHVSQRRVSAVEHGDLARTNLGTVATYVAALGGRIEIVASFGDERIVIGLPGRLPMPCMGYPVILLRAPCLRKCRLSGAVTLQLTLNVPSRPPYRHPG